MPTQKLTPEIINAAILGFEAQKTSIDDQIAELRVLLDGGTKPTPAATPEAPTGRRRKFSAAARKRMKEAQQRRWAKIRGGSEPPAPAMPEAAKAKRRISEAGLKKIIAATRKRFALKRAEAANAEQAANKKTAARKKAVKTAPAKVAKRVVAVKKSAAKKSAAKKSAAKKTALAPAQVGTETAAQ